MIDKYGPSDWIKPGIGSRFNLRNFVKIAFRTFCVTALGASVLLATLYIMYLLSKIPERLFLSIICGVFGVVACFLIGTITIHLWWKAVDKIGELRHGKGKMPY